MEILIEKLKTLKYQPQKPFSLLEMMYKTGLWQGVDTKRNACRFIKTE